MNGNRHSPSTKTTVFGKNTSIINIYHENIRIRHGLVHAFRSCWWLGVVHPGIPGMRHRELDGNWMVNWFELWVFDGKKLDGLDGEKLNGVIFLENVSFGGYMTL